jgi:hypothetical protein
MDVTVNISKDCDGYCIKLSVEESYPGGSVEFTLSTDEECDLESAVDNGREIMKELSEAIEREFADWAKL